MKSRGVIFLGATVFVALTVSLVCWQHSQSAWKSSELERLRSRQPADGPKLARLRAEVAQLRAHQGAVAEVDRLRNEVEALKSQNNGLAQQLAEERQASAANGRAGNRPGIATVDGGLVIQGQELSFLADPGIFTHQIVAGKGPSWSHAQAVGAPDTEGAGDIPTAWASREPDAGIEWLRLKYPSPVEISQINVHETYNPGAVSKITALRPDGSEQTLWEGTAPVSEAPVETGFPVPPGIRSDQIKVYLDTARVPGWNEIDAVEIVAPDGSRHWATESSASTYYGDNRSGARSIIMWGAVDGSGVLSGTARQ
jgi:hypothetical protein